MGKKILVPCLDVCVCVLCHFLERVYKYNHAEMEDKTQPQWKILDYLSFSSLPESAAELNRPLCFSLHSSFPHKR